MIVRAAVYALAVLAMGCSTAVHPPAVAPADALAVYVADYGVHSAVMLPVSQMRYVEYAFGDWGYCAHNHEAPQDALGALVLSRGSAFGRRFIEQKPGDRYPMPRGAPKHIFKIYASRDAIRREVRKLDTRWQRNSSLVVHNSDNDTDYVKDSQPYSWNHSCNSLTSTTLRDLGCTLNGPRILSNFYLSSPQGPPPPPELSAPVYASSPAQSSAPTARADDGEALAR